MNQEITAFLTEDNRKKIDEFAQIFMCYRESTLQDRELIIDLSDAAFMSKDAAAEAKLDIRKIEYFWLKGYLLCHHLSLSPEEVSDLEWAEFLKYFNFISKYIDECGADTRPSYNYLMEEVLVDWVED